MPICGLSRFTAWATLSAILGAAVVQHALATREQFYPAVIYLATSKFSVVVLANLAAVLLVGVARLVKVVFLGDLRPREVERVTETLRYTIPEVCIALTLFREELSPRVLSLFGMLLFSKFFHASLEERVNAVEVQGLGAFSRSAHARMSLLMALLFAMNAQCLAVFSSLLIDQGASVLFLFAAEYCLLELELVRIVYRYSIAIIARNMPAEWPSRSLYLLYGKLLVDIARLLVTSAYFYLLSAHYGMPIIMVRDLVRAASDVHKELSNLIAVRALRRQIHTLFVSPSEVDIATRDALCVVCHEDILATPVHRAAAKKLPCGHMFHTNCLLPWWERQQNCPTCRADLQTMLRAAQRAQAVDARVRGAAAAVAGAAAEGVAPAQGVGAAAVAAPALTAPAPAAAQAAAGMEAGGVPAVGAREAALGGAAGTPAPAAARAHATPMPALGTGVAGTPAAVVAASSSVSALAASSSALRSRAHVAARMRPRAVSETSSSSSSSSSGSSYSSSSSSSSAHEGPADGVKLAMRIHRAEAKVAAANASLVALLQAAPPAAASRAAARRHDRLRRAGGTEGAAPVAMPGAFSAAASSLPFPSPGFAPPPYGSPVPPLAPGGYNPLLALSPFASPSAPQQHQQQAQAQAQWAQYMAFLAASQQQQQAQAQAAQAQAAQQQQLAYFAFLQQQQQQQQQAAVQAHAQAAALPQPPLAPAPAMGALPQLPADALQQLQQLMSLAMPPAPAAPGVVLPAAPTTPSLVQAPLAAPLQQPAAAPLLAQLQDLQARRAALEQQLALTQALSSAAAAQPT